MKKFTIELKSCGNPDFGQNPDEAISPPQTVPFDTIEEAKIVQSDYISEYQLGGGNWCGGNIYKDKRIIAYMSYNGRIWGSSTGIYDPNNKEITGELS